MPAGSSCSECGLALYCAGDLCQGAAQQAAAEGHMAAARGRARILQPRLLRGFGDTRTPRLRRRRQRACTPVQPQHLTEGGPCGGVELQAAQPAALHRLAVSMLARAAQPLAVELRCALWRLLTARLPWPERRSSGRSAARRPLGVNGWDCKFRVSIQLMLWGCGQSGLGQVYRVCSGNYAPMAAAEGPPGALQH